MKRRRVLSKQISVLIACFFILSIAGGIRIGGTSLPVYVKPINADNSLNPNKTYTYTFNWTTDSSCNNVIFSNQNITVTTGTDGVGFINLTIPDTISSIPDYLCEYRNGTLRAVNALSTQFFNSVYSSGAYYGNGSGLTNLNASTLNNYNASFFMPLNTSVFGNFNFNGGWQNGGLSIIGGNLYSNGTIYSVNFSNLNVSNININGSFLPYLGYDNQFNLGNGTLRWNNVFMGGNLYSNGTLYENSVPISTEYYPINNPYSYYNSTTIPNYTTWANVVNGTMLSYANALNGTLATWAEVMNGTVSGGGITWAQATNGTLATNSSGLLANWSLILNGTGLIQNWNSTGYVANWNASGLIANWSQIISAGSGITWAQATNGTLLLSSQWNATNTSYYLNSNPYGFYNSTNPQPISNIFNQVLNTTSNVTFNNVTAVAVNGTTVYSGNNNLTIGYLYATNNTWNANYSNFSNVYGYALNDTLWTLNYSNFSNVYAYENNGTFLRSLGNLSINITSGFFNISNQTKSGLFYINATTGNVGIGTTTPQNTLNVLGTENSTTVFSGNNNLTIGYLYATNGTYALNGANIFNQVLNTTSNITFFNVSAQNLMANNICYTNGTGCPASSGITWAQAINGTLYLSSNPQGFITWTNATNGTLFLASQWNATNTSYYLISNPYGFYNSTTLPSGITWANVINGTVYLSSNPYSFYNSTTFQNVSQLKNDNGYYNSSTLPNVNASGLLANWSLILNGTGLIQNWNSTGYVANWNASGLIANWSQIISAGSGITWDQALNGTLATWAEVMNGTVSGGGITWAQATNGTLMLAANWNATNTSYYLVTNPFNFYNLTTLQNVSQLTNNNGYYNSSSGLNNLSWGNIINGTVYLSSNSYSFYNSTTLPNVNASGLINNWSLILNSTGLIKDWNSSGLIINWSNVISGGSGGNPFNQVLNTTSNVTFNNVTAVAVNGTTVYSGNNNLTIGYLYATNNTWNANYSNFSNVYGYALNDTLWTLNYSNFSNVYAYENNGTYIKNNTVGWNESFVKIAVTNISVSSLINLSQTTTLPTCSSSAGTNGSIMRNNTGLVYCNRTGTWVYLLAG